jgi:hypothetical protein
VGARAGEQLHDGRVDSYPAGNCCYRGAAQYYSGPQSFVVCRRLPIQGDNKKGSTMKTNSLIGIFLIVIGIIAFAYQGISYTSREKVIDIGPLQVTADKTRTLPLPPIVGGIALVGGIVLLVMGNKKS